jgi:hypothetical protein
MGLLLGGFYRVGAVSQGIKEGVTVASGGFHLKLPCTSYELE